MRATKEGAVMAAVVQAIAPILLAVQIARRLRRVKILKNGESHIPKRCTEVRLEINI